MATKKSNQIDKLIDFINFFNNTQISGSDYRGSDKNKFKLGGKFALKRLAAQLGLLDKIDYDLRFNEGGPIVTGEVTLHTNNIYIQISGCCARHAILIRTCDGRKDYTGDQNHFLDISSFLDGRLLNLISQLIGQKEQKQAWIKSFGFDKT